MELLSDTYGWTPNQIRELDYHEVNSYLKIIYIKNQMNKAGAKHGGKRT